MGGSGEFETSFVFGTDLLYRCCERACFCAGGGADEEGVANASDDGRGGEVVAGQTAGDVWEAAEGEFGGDAGESTFSFVGK